MKYTIAGITSSKKLLTKDGDKISMKKFGEMIINGDEFYFENNTGFVYFSLSDRVSMAIKRMSFSEYSIYLNKNFINKK